MRAGSGTGIQSPLIITSRSAAPGAAASASCASIHACISAGTVFHSVTRCRFTSSLQCRGSAERLGSGMTTAPPAASRPNTS